VSGIIFHHGPGSHSSNATNLAVQATQSRLQ